MRDRLREHLVKHPAHDLVVGVVILVLGVGLLLLVEPISQACPFDNPDQCQALRCCPGVVAFCALGLLGLAAKHLLVFGLRSFELLRLKPGDVSPSGDTEKRQPPQAPVKPASRWMDAEELLACYDAGERAFSWAVLPGADLQEANLSFAILRRADLRGANLSRAILCGAVLRRADLRRASLLDANLEGADLARATLCHTNLISTTLVEANLTGADLRQALLRKANLRDAQLHAADLRDADLSEANLAGARIRANELALARSLSGTTLPDGTVHE